MYKIVLFSAAGALLAFVLSAPGVRWLHGLLSARSPPLPDDAVADVAIILGYALFRNGSLTEPLKGRVQAGVDVFNRGRARHLVFSGSHPGGRVGVGVQHSEANVMQVYAQGLLPQGRGELARERWLQEPFSTSTYENALFSLEICRQKGWKTLLIITSPFHQFRSERVFRRLALKSAPTLKVVMARCEVVRHAGYFPAPMNRLVDLWDWARELLALVYYWAKDRL